MPYTTPDCYGNTQPHDSNSAAELEYNGVSFPSQFGRTDPDTWRDDPANWEQDEPNYPQYDARDYYVPTREEVEAARDEEARKQALMDSQLAMLTRVFTGKSSLDPLI